MAKYVLKAEVREATGSRAMKHMRNSGRLPAVIYGHKQQNRLVSFDGKEIKHFIHAGHRLLTVDIGGVEENGILKEVQYGSNGTEIIHLDISRVDIHEKISAPVPIETIGVPKGLSAGGSLDLPKREVLVEGPASSIPEKIEIKIESLDLGHVLRIKDLERIPECKFLDDPEQVVAAIHTKRVEEEAPEAATAEAQMPEVIGGKKEEPGEKEAGGKEGKQAEGKK